MKYFFGTFIVLQILLALYYLIMFTDTHDFYYGFWMVFNLFFMYINCLNLKDELK